jgi:hypothetical protein
MSFVSQPIDGNNVYEILDIPSQSTDEEVFDMYHNKNMLRSEAFEVIRLIMFM